MTHYDPKKPVGSFVRKRMGLELGLPEALRTYKDPIFKMLPDSCEVAVEVGSLQGWFAYRIMKHTQVSRLYCVDSWESYSTMGDGEYNRRCFKRNLAEWLESGRCVEVPTFSVEAAKRFKSFEERQIDWVFIDGDHSTHAVLSDLHAWEPMVRSGGLVSGHDWTGDHKKSVRAAVNAYRRTLSESTVLCHGFVYDFTGKGSSAHCWWWYKT